MSCSSENEAEKVTEKKDGEGYEEDEGGGDDEDEEASEYDEEGEEDEDEEEEKDDDDDEEEGPGLRYLIEDVSSTKHPTIGS